MTDVKEGRENVQELAQPAHSRNSDAFRHLAQCLQRRFIHVKIIKHAFGAREIQNLGQRSNRVCLEEIIPVDVVTREAHVVADVEQHPLVEDAGLVATWTSIMPFAQRRSQQLHRVFALACALKLASFNCPEATEDVFHKVVGESRFVDVDSARALRRCKDLVDGLIVKIFLAFDPQRLAEHPGWSAAQQALVGLGLHGQVLAVAWDQGEVEARAVDQRHLA